MKIQWALQGVPNALEEHLQPAMQIMPEEEHLSTMSSRLKEAADVTQNNFYVDYLLKSVKDLDTAKTLVNNVINMVKNGEFNLI